MGATQNLKLLSFLCNGEGHDAGVITSRLPEVVVWLLSQVAVLPFHLTYLYCTAVLTGKVTVPVQGTLAPLP